MMDVSTSVVSVVLVLLCVVSDTQACSCMPMSLQQYYCQADFAVIGRVSNWTVDSDLPWAASSYTVHILKSYKIPPQFANETEITVHSTAQDGLCGINPGRYQLAVLGRKRTKPVFLTGSLEEDGTLTSRLCKNTYRFWRWMSRSERKAIRKLRNLTC